MTDKDLEKQNKIIVGLENEITNLHTRLFKMQAITSLLIIGLSIIIIYLSSTN